MSRIPWLTNETQAWELSKSLDSAQLESETDVPVEILERRTRIATRS